MPDRDSYNNGNSGDEVGANADDICRDFLRNVCKRGKRCRFRHPDISEVTNLGVRKNEFIFCHDFQNKECVRLNCRFIHGTKEDEDCYKKTGELPPRLRQKVAAGLGLSPADLPNSKEEVPICRDFLKGDCQRGAKCKFQHLQRDYEYEARGMAAREQGIVPTVRRYDPYDAIYDPDRYDDHDPVLKRRRVDGLHFETYEYSFASPRTVEYRLLEEENIMLRKRVEDLKKQVNNLLATNEVLLEQNAQFRNQAKVMTLSSTATATEQTLAPTVGTVTNYNHSIAQTHTTLSSQALQPRPVSQQDLVAPAGAQAAPPANAAPPMNPEITPLSAALAQTIAQGMAPPGLHGTGGCFGGAGGRFDGAAVGWDHHEPRHHPHGDLPHRLPEHEDNGHAPLTAPCRGDHAAGEGGRGSRWDRHPPVKLSRGGGRADPPQPVDNGGGSRLVVW